MNNILYVEWLDTAGYSGIYNLSEAKNLEPVLVKQVGFLIGKTTDKIVIAMQTEGNNCRKISVIPTKMVVKMCLLQEQSSTLIEKELDK